jgi:4-nitrophenyl phosphatase
MRMAVPLVSPDHLLGCRGFLFDVDGVILRNGSLLPGVAEFLHSLASDRVPFAFLTNNTTLSADDHRSLFSSLGLSVPIEHIVTAVDCVIQELCRLLPAGRSIYVVGTPVLAQAVQRAGYILSDKKPDGVVVGMDPHVTYDHLRKATQMILDGALFIGTNPDVTIPADDGIAPETGALLAALQAATGVRPVIGGKPQATPFRLALERLQVPARQTVMVGDRLDTDIAGARRLRLRSILMLTGITREEDLVNLPRRLTPTAVAQTMEDIARAWMQAAELSLRRPGMPP